MGHLILQIERGKGVDELDNGTELHGLIWLVEEKMEEMRKLIEAITMGFNPFGGGAIKIGLLHVSTIRSSNIFGAFGNDIGMRGKGEFRG
ncbi:hypothetical protein Goarm_017665, partial [Gossypium armourianum]|nr:hypothetical protein [Gossypium armourianum]